MPLPSQDLLTPRAPRTRRIAVLQLDALPGQRRRNAEAAAAMVIGARADLVVLPELFATEFFVWEKDNRYFAYAEDLQGEVVSTLRAAAKEAGSVVIAPFFERHESGAYYNSAAVLLPDGSVAGVYRKTHIPFTRSYEKYYFTPGHTLPVFDTPAGRIGVLICYDRWYPEAWRKLVAQGAEIVCCPISSGALDGLSEAPVWEPLLRIRARESLVFVAAANRSGIEPPYDNLGCSMIVSPLGDVLAGAPKEGRLALSAEIDLDEVPRQRQSMPFLRDRRPELY